MAKQLFLTDLDLAKNQLLNARLQNLASHPTVYAPTDANDPDIDKDLGLVYWNTTDKTAYFLAGYTPGTFTPIWKSLGSGTGSGVLTAPITFSIAAGKTLGKYVGGTIQTIGTTGMPIEDLIRDIALESLPPTSTLSITSSQPEYNSSDIVNTLSFSYTIKTAGATIADGFPTLEFKRSGQTEWTSLPATGNSYTHSNLNVVDKVSGFEYRYIVTDSSGATVTKTATVTPKVYLAPTTQSTTDSKELGDIVFSTNRTIDKNSVNTTLNSWQIFVELNNNGTKIPIDSSSDFSTNPSINIASNGTVNGTLVSGILSATSIKVYIRVIDSVTTVDLLTFNRSLEIKKFYGSRQSTITNYRTELTSVSNSVTSLSWYASGKVHVIALPAGKTIISVMTSNNENVTSNFVDGLNPNGLIPDAGGTNRTYNIYTFTSVIDFNVTLTATIQ